MGQGSDYYKADMPLPRKLECRTLFLNVLSAPSRASFAAHFNQVHLLDVYDRKSKGA